MRMVVCGMRSGDGERIRPGEEEGKRVGSRQSVIDKE